MRRRVEGVVVSHIAESHDRTDFDCGNTELNAYLRQYAWQHDEKGVARTYVLAQEGQNQVIGFYSIRGGEVEFADAADDRVKKLKRYPVRVFHIGRLGVDSRFQNKGYGEYLLMHALDQALLAQSVIGGQAIELRAKDDKARGFYAKYGFRGFSEDPLHMYLLIDDVQSIGE